MNIALPFLIATLGSLFQELIYWFGLRAKLDMKTNQKLLKSWKYWLIVLLMALGSGLGTVIWFFDSLDSLALRDFFLVGAALPALFKVGVSAAGAGSNPSLGETNQSEVATYFK